MGAPSGRTPFVGREHELRQLHAALEQALAGRGAVALLAGEPGIGKTRLVEELAGDAGARRMRVLWGRCYEGDGAPAFWPWVQILRVFLRGASEETLHAALGRGGSAIAQLVPELQERLPDLPPPPPLTPAQARFRLFESVTDALTAIGRRPPPPAPPPLREGEEPHYWRRSVDQAPRPRAAGEGAVVGLILMLDDLHWADVPSLLLLRFLAREIREAPVLVVGTYRDVEVGRQHPLAGILADLARLEHVRRIQLGGLSEAEAVALIAGTAGAKVAAGVTSAVVAETGGNPFFLAEMVRLLIGEGHLAGSDGAPNERVRAGVPQGVREVIGCRLDRLSASCNRVLGAAAVIGREFSLRVMQQVAELTPDQLLTALEEAEAARIVAAMPDAPGWYRFSHALVRETLYEELPGARRVRLHKLAGEALQSLYAQAPDAHMAELAHHFLQAAPGGDVDVAIDYARRAGDRALALLAFEEAAGHYERALRAVDLMVVRDEWLSCELLLALGDARMRAGETGAAQAAFDEAATIARSLARDEEQLATRQAASLLSRAALGYGRAGTETGRVNERLVALLEEALAAQEVRNSGVRVRLLGRLAMELHYGDARERRAALSAEALAIARRLGDPGTLAVALHARHLALWEPENIEERISLCTELPAVAEAAGDVEMLLQGHLLSVPALLEVGEIESARRAIATYARLADEQRQPLFRWHATRLRALCAYLDGDLEQMERLAREALAIAERAQVGGADVLFVSHLQFLRREQGRYAEMEGPIEEIIARYPRLAEGWRLTLANLHAQSGRTTEARRELDEQAAGEFAAVGRGLYSLGVTALLTEAIVAADHSSAAAVVYARLLPYAGRYLVNAAAPNLYGAAAHYLGCLAAALGRAETAIGHFETALAMNRRIGVRPLIAHTQYELAAALVARGHPDDGARAAELAEQGLATARQIGMARLAEQAGALIEGITRLKRDSAVPRAVAAPLGSLTARELEVLSLLATGMSNREIAETLVVTVNTVERHLVSVYGKLGVKGRAAATAYAHRHGLAG